MTTAQVIRRVGLTGRAAGALVRLKGNPCSISCSPIYGGVEDPSAARLPFTLLAEHTQLQEEDLIERESLAGSV